MDNVLTVAKGADAERIVKEVRERYARIAEEGATCGPKAGCCGSSAEAEAVSLEIGYSADDLNAAADANLGLGCGAPLRHLALQPGETVLDLGSGPGLDAFLAARQVGPGGHVIGVDMTPAMLAKARAGAERLGFAHVEFREGRLEHLPVEAASVDAVTSNCVINLVPDKAVVFAEVARVLRPGGRLVISDIVLAGALPEALARDIYAYVGCISGADQREAYFDKLRRAGLGDIDVLSDVDYLAKLATAAPTEVQQFLERTGIAFDQVAGIVRSVTYRARKPA
jgi:SAM-dependent methyltransferase